ncbi:MAG: monofunctional biosynthetic peptidoglycan transglycosylase [bacterium]
MFFTGCVFFLFSVIVILYLKFFPPPTTAFIDNQKNENIESFVLPSEIEYEWVSMDKISGNMALAVIASEDQRFAEHWGFDLEQIQKAIKEKERGRRVRGASTISQQVAKNLFLWNDKNYIRKGLEAYYTILIELLWSKERIIETYLNIAELGENVYGVQAASTKFFKKDAIKLNSAQAAILAAVIPNPKRFKANRPSKYILRRQSQIQTQMNYIGGKAYLEKFM